MKKYLSKLHILYLSTFLFGAHMAFLAYFDSSFLEKFAGERYVGIVYAAAAFLSLFMLDKIPEILSKKGNRKTTLYLLAIDAITLCGIVVFNKAYLLIPLFILHNAFLFVFIFNFDIFLEHYTANQETGDIRGKYLTIGNIAWVVSPFLAGLMLTSGGNGDMFKLLYLISAILLLPVIAIIYFSFKDFQDHEYHHPTFWKTVKEIHLNKNIYKIFMVSFLLQFFFSWMGIYTPIYLHEQMGFGWDQIGLLFTIMLLPYVFFTIPAGKLADKKFGEKELLSVGFIITAITSASVAFITSTNFWVWAAIMFATRIGASFIDVMNETYFFKHVSDTDANIISFFRNAGPLAYIISPVIATIFLGIFPSVKFLFLILGLTMLIGLKYSMTIRDTR